MTDYVGLVVSRLNADWDIGNTAGRKPTIRKIIEITDHNLTASDFCGVYAGDETEEPRYIGYAGNKWTTAISFTLSTAVSHTHLILIREEARRVVHTARKNLEDRALWHWKRAIDVSDKRRGTYKYVIDTDVELQTELMQ